MSKVVIDKEGDEFLKQFDKDKTHKEKLADKLIFELKKIGITYNDEHNFHLLMMREFINEQINIHQLKKLFKVRFYYELKKRGIKL